MILRNELLSLVTLKLISKYPIHMSVEVLAYSCGTPGQQDSRAYETRNLGNRSRRPTIKRNCSVNQNSTSRSWSVDDILRGWADKKTVAAPPSVLTIQYTLLFLYLDRQTTASIQSYLKPDSLRISSSSCFNLAALPWSSLPQLAESWRLSPSPARPLTIFADGR